MRFSFQLSTFNFNLYLGGYSAEVPPLPIPNRVVKLSIADGTALRCGRVGSRHFERVPLGTLFFAFKLLFYIAVQVCTRCAGFFVLSGGIGFVWRCVTYSPFGRNNSLMYLPASRQNSALR